MLGAIAGDIIGSRFEFDNCRSKDFELFDTNCRFTDDTVCIIAVADWINKGKPIDFSSTLRDWCLAYPNAGYGPLFRYWIHEAPTPYGSFGNGAAMRVAPIGWLNVTYTDLMRIVTQTTDVSHNHIDAQKGAKAIVSTMWMVRNNYDKAKIRYEIQKEFGYTLGLKVFKTLDTRCITTVPVAIACFLASKSFEDAVRIAVSLGGDSDTIASMAGTIAEAYYGLPEQVKQETLTFLPKEMLLVYEKFASRYIDPCKAHYVP